jgi:hypothetical protein
MTTQAQIDAALDAFHKVPHSEGLPSRIKAALIAAAEVHEEQEIEDALKASLGDIAEVTQIPLSVDNVAKIKHETIDRCAQVADDFGADCETDKMQGIFRELAAAIRTMKDKP